MWFSNGSQYPSGVSTYCVTPTCNDVFYTTGSTISINDVIYYDPALTQNIGPLAINFGLSGGGLGRMYLSNDCPIVGTRIIVQIDGTGKVISQPFPC
jgi:hypothetical protein